MKPERAGSVPRVAVETDAGRSGLRISYTNACSVGNKWGELRQRMGQESVIAIAKSWLTPDEQTGNLGPPGYCIYRADREDGRTGGGVLLMVAQQHDQHSFLKLVTPNIQGVSLSIKVGKTVTRVACIYRSPTASMEESMELFHFLNEQIRTNGKLLIMGDFNAPEINWNTETAPQGTFGRDLVRYMQKHGLVQHVDHPTRFRDGQESSLLDLMFTRVYNDISKFVIEAPLGKSDHGLISANFVVMGSKPPHKYIRAYSKIDAVALQERARMFNWAEYTQDSVCRQWEGLKAKLLALTEEMAPLRMVRRQGSLPWWTSRASKAQRGKSIAWARYKGTKGHRRYLHYKVACAKALRVQRECREKYELRLARNAKRNPKAYYNYVQSRAALRRVVGNVMGPDGKHATTNQEKADTLFRHFLSVYQIDEGSSSVSLNVRAGVSEMEEVIISPEEVAQALRKLNTVKAAGPDGIHPAIMKPLADIIAEPLAQLFNKSLRQQELPTDWKNASVTPIHKGGDADKVGNYRPVSLTSTVLKVMERILRDKVVGHVTRQKLLTAQQHGFIRKKSCLSNLLCFLDEITKRIDKGQRVEVCYLDFQKAFDSVNHRFLLAKLESFQLGKGLIGWIEKFLVGRQINVVVEGERSQSGVPTSGVPQGSVLGPLLFLLFVNDLALQLENPCYMFADDLKIVGRPTDESVQRDLDRLFAWSIAWQLPLNIAKCQHLTKEQQGSHSRMLGPAEGQTALPVTAVARDLGVAISNTFKPTAQSAAANQKANRALHQLRRAVSSREPEVVVPLYKVFVRPHLEYCVQAWSPYLKKDINRIERTQRRFTRWFVYLRGIPYEERLKRLNLFSMKRRRMRGDLIEAFRLLKGFSMPGEQPLLHLKVSRDLRGNGMKLRKEHVSSSQRANFFSVRVVNHWNKLPRDIVSANTIPEFKRKLDGAWEEIFAGMDCA